MESISMLFWLGGPQLGGFQAGWLAALVGAPFAVIIGGSVSTIITVLMSVEIPTLRNYRAKKE